MKNTITTICLALAMAFGISGGALADGHTKTGPYAGLGLEHTKISNDRNGAELTGWTPSIFGGYMPHRNFGVEGGFKLYSLEAKTSNGTAEDTGNLFYLAGIGRYYIASDFAIYAKGGFHRWKVESKIDHVNNNLDDSSSISGFDGLFGAGVQFDLSDDASVRLEYVRYLMDEEEGNNAVDGEADILALQLLYRF